MIWYLATVLLAVAALFVLWPLITHWQPKAEAETAAGGGERRRRELEELDLDVAAGRLSAAEAAARRRELE